MQADLDELVAFHLAGERPAAGGDAPDGPGGSTGLGTVAGLGLRPALFAHYRDLSALRHDFPLLLCESVVEPPPPAVPVLTLSGLIDGLLADLTADLAADDRERLRHHALRLEREIRRALIEGAAGSFSELWRRAESRLLETNGGDALLVDSLARLGRALAVASVDGPLVGCDRDVAERLVTHLWRRAQRRKAGAAGRRLERLGAQLADILRADEANSAAGLAPERLRASIGGAFGAEIDFGAVSRLLTTAKPSARLPAARRQRLERLLAELGAAKVLFEDRSIDAAIFTSAAAALDAWRQAMPERLRLVKAMWTAELEVEGRYREAAHDALFAAVGDAEMGATERALVPDPLVVVRADDISPEESAAIDEILNAALPVRILLRSDDLAGSPDRLVGTAGAASRARVHAAIGLTGVFVLQSAASHLYRQLDALGRACDFSGPALLSIYSGAGGELGDVPPYLAAAAAVEARAFPSLVFDPSAGEDCASRLSLAHNPQPEADWPVYPFQYETEALQRVSLELPVTLADFLACDARWSGALARVPKERWNGSLASVPEAMASEASGLPARVPALFLVDSGHRLHRVVVESRLLRLTRRAREQWRSLQELGGIRNSYLERRLADERRAWESEQRASAPPTVVDGAATPSPAAAPAPAAAGESAVAVAAPSARSRDEAYIETARCSTCNECIHINDRMFQYDGNKQAFIADLAAGTYAQLVQAAESCQVAVIHTGKPRDAGEPGLDELLKRAEPFR